MPDSKLTGRLMVPEVDFAAVDWPDDVFYKGGIKDRMEAGDGT